MIDDDNYGDIGCGNDNKNIVYRTVIKIVVYSGNHQTDINDTLDKIIIISKNYF